MCKFFEVFRSGYYEFVQCLGRPGKDTALAKIIAEQRKRSFRTYGLPADVAMAEKPEYLL